MSSLSLLYLNVMDICVLVFIAPQVFSPLSTNLPLIFSIPQAIHQGGCFLMPRPSHPVPRQTGRGSVFKRPAVESDDIYVPSQGAVPFCISRCFSTNHVPCVFRCKYGGTSCPFVRHETELLLSYACLLPQFSVDYSFPNLYGMRYQLDASIIPTILDVPSIRRLAQSHCPSIPLAFSSARKYSVADPTTYLPIRLPTSSRPPLEFRLVPSPFHFSVLLVPPLFPPC